MGTGGGFAFGANYVSAVSNSGASTAPVSGQASKSAVIPSALDGELSQQLQRLTKRDSTTRMKSLQALRELAAIKPVTDLLVMLPSWAYLFGRLVMDANRSVRCEACLAMGAVAAAIGRDIAPYLKALLPAWYLAQFDAQAEVSAAAQVSLRGAFPGDKESGAVLFCSTEVGHTCLCRWAGGQ